VVGLGARGPERGDLDDLATEADVGKPETPADQPRVAEHVLNLIGIRVGRNVEIFGLALQQQVAHTATDDERLVAGVFQAVQDLERALRDVRAADVVLRARHDDGSGTRLMILVVQEATVLWFQRPGKAGIITVLASTRHPRSLRLAVQDVALSRLKQGFDSPRERHLSPPFVGTLDSS